MHELPPLPRGIRTLTDVESERLRERFPTLPSSPDQCVTCYGAGSFRFYGPERHTVDNVAEHKCSCVDQWILHRYLLNSNIGLSYQRLCWHDVHVEDGARAKVWDYLEHSRAYVGAGCGLILFGEVGTGKTLLATLLLKGLLAEGYDGYFTTFSEMIDTYTGGWYDAEERKWFHRRIKNAQVLVLDDIGREWQGRKKQHLPESTFDEVLRHRVAGSLPTIITTNKSLDDLAVGYGGNVMSLLHERSTTYQFVGEDFRDQARLRLDDEVRAGIVRPVMLL